MSSTPEVIKEFPVCPWCESTETGASLAIKHLKLIERGILKEGDFISHSKVMAPLIVNPAAIVLTIPLMIHDIDCCGECGRNRIVRVSVMEAPVGTKLPGQPGQP